MDSTIVISYIHNHLHKVLYIHTFNYRKVLYADLSQYCSSSTVFGKDPNHHDNLHINYHTTNLPRDLHSGARSADRPISARQAAVFRNPEYSVLGTRYGYKNYRWFDSKKSTSEL